MSRDGKSTPAVLRGRGRQPLHFRAQCPECKRWFDAVTRLGLDQRVNEHLQLCYPAQAKKRREEEAAAAQGRLDL